MGLVSRALEEALEVRFVWMRFRWFVLATIREDETLKNRG